MDAASGVIPVVLSGSEPASGLAEMLQQFIEQTLTEPRKERLARRLSGHVVFRPAEDEALCVCIRFAGDHIELRDLAAADSADTSITADFLTIAHLTSGRVNLFRLLVQRKLKVRFSVLRTPFLFRMLRFMQSESESRRAIRTRWALAAAASAAAAAAVYCYLTAGS